MNILQINTVYAEGSTGKIVMELSRVCKENGIENRAAVRCADKQTGVMEISGRTDSRIHGKLAQYTMHKGCFSYRRTKRFLKKVDKDRPDIIHLHNLHGSYVNIGLLMDYAKRNDIPVVFTLHDCWAFTAICPHFGIVNCDRWQTGCGNCPQRKKYSSSWLDLTGRVWNLKKKWFTGVKSMTVVTPSAWLASKVKDSFLKDYPVRVIRNGIDTDIFQPTPSSFRQRYGLENKKIVLGVAFGWSYEKGIDIMAALSERLREDYRVVLVGTDERAEKLLPNRIISVRRTYSQRELAEIYSAADVFVNPTREEAFGLTNIEALACGTPVITFRAGGSPECIDETCGTAVEIDDLDGLVKEVVRISEEHPYTEEDCVRRAKRFDKKERLSEYMALYKEMGDI